MHNWYTIDQYHQNLFKLNRIDDAINSFVWNKNLSVSAYVIPGSEKFHSAIVGLVIVAKFSSNAGWIATVVWTLESYPTVIRYIEFLYFATCLFSSIWHWCKFVNKLNLIFMTCEMHKDNIVLDVLLTFAWFVGLLTIWTFTSRCERIYVSAWLNSFHVCTFHLALKSRNHTHFSASNSQTWTYQS